MSLIKSSDTKPEIAVRKLFCKLGYRVKKCWKALPGKPDIVLKDSRIVVFVHGCFWHGHKSCKRASVPKSNKAFWTKKIKGNVARDKRNIRLLRKKGWRVLVLWGCEISNKKKTLLKIIRFTKHMKDIRNKCNDLRKLINNFESELNTGNLRSKVIALIPVFHELRKIGKALIPEQTAASARDRILFYFKKYSKIIIRGDELLVVSAIQEYARRIRELRVQFGWSIMNGVTAKEMAKENEIQLKGVDFSQMGPDDYILLDEHQDAEAALRWNIANEIRRKNIGVRDKILEYFRKNVGKAVTGEELHYLAKERKEWARRVRELRTEFGWPIITKNTGRPDLRIGVYVLESDRQSPAHDRNIPDDIRAAVLRRDDYKCKKCKWMHELWNRSDPRHLELHHLKEHVKGGENKPDNLVTLCSLCHDVVHRKKK